MADMAINMISDVALDNKPPTLEVSCVSTASSPLLALARTKPQMNIDATFAAEVISIEDGSTVPFDCLSLGEAALGATCTYWNKAYEKAKAPTKIKMLDTFLRFCY